MWESMNSLNFCESALMEFSLFLLCMFSPVEYNAAKSLGDKTVRTLAIFFLHIHSHCVLCGKKIRRNSRIHGRNSRQFFRGIFNPALYSVPFCLTGTLKNCEKSVQKASKWWLGRSGRGPGRSGRTFHGQLSKKGAQKRFTDTLCHLFWDPILDTF